MFILYTLWGLVGGGGLYWGLMGGGGLYYVFSPYLNDDCLSSPYHYHHCYSRFPCDSSPTSALISMGRICYKWGPFIFASPPPYSEDESHSPNDFEGSPPLHRISFHHYCWC